MDSADLARELQKIADVLEMANQHFGHEAQMNAALHMSTTVRPAPLAAAVATAGTSALRLISILNKEAQA